MNRQKITFEQVESLKKQTTDVYNWIADAYAEEWSSNPDFTIINKFLTLIPKNIAILDVGSGPGHYSKIFSERGHKVTAIDLSSMMLTQAKKIWSGGVFVQMDMQNLGFAAGVFDAIWACASFAHIPEVIVMPTLIEFRRVLDKNRLLFINAKIDLEPVLIEAVDEMKDYKKEGRFFQRYESTQHFENYLTEAGFQVIGVLENQHFVTGKNKKIKPRPENTVAHWVNYYCTIT